MIFITVANKLDDVRRMYGSHMAMRLATERSIFGRPHRLAGLETGIASQPMSFQTVSGTDEKIDFTDFLNLPNNRPDVPKLDIHSQMEIKLGLM